MDILMSDILKDRVSISTIEKQITDTTLGEDVNKNRILNIQNDNNIITVMLECDNQLLDIVYNFSIGLDTDVKIKSSDLNLKTNKDILYKIIYANIDYTSSIKKITIKLIRE